MLKMNEQSHVDVLSQVDCNELSQAKETWLQICFGAAKPFLGDLRLEVFLHFVLQGLLRPTHALLYV